MRKRLTLAVSNPLIVSFTINDKFHLSVCFVQNYASGSSKTGSETWELLQGYVSSPTLTNPSPQNQESNNLLCCGDWGICMCSFITCFSIPCFFFFHCLHKKLCSICSLCHPFIYWSMIPTIAPYKYLFSIIYCAWGTVLVTLDREKDIISGS